MGCLSIQTTMLARLSGGSRIRRNARRERVGGRRASERLRLRKEGRDEAYQSRPAAGKEAQGAACKEVSLFVSTLRLCLGGDSQRRRRQAGVPSSSNSSEHARPTVHHGPLTTPVRSPPPPLGAADESPPWDLLSFRDELQIKRPNPR
jgi:hypothetical protein